MPPSQACNSPFSGKRQRKKPTKQTSVSPQTKIIIIKYSCSYSESPKHSKYYPCVCSADSSVFTPAAFPCPEFGRQQKREWKSSLSRQAAEIRGMREATVQGKAQVMSRANEELTFPAHRTTSSRVGICVLLFAYNLEDGTGTPVNQTRGKGSYRASAQFSDEFS